MKQCFQKDPGSRPNFETIKGDLTATYEAMTALDTSSSNGSGTGSNLGRSLPLNKVLNNAMETQYRIMLKKNKTYDSMKENDKDNDVPIGVESLKYASLEGVQCLI
jgi:hypothetical protein